LKIAVLTSLIGNGNFLSPPMIKFDDVDYYAYTDQQNIEGWNRIKPIDFSYDRTYSNRRSAKIPKILPSSVAPNYDYYVWTDSTHQIVVHPSIMIENFMQNCSMGVFKHPFRNCVYDEADIIKEISFDHKDLVDSQMNFYRGENYRKDNGLYELGAFITKNDEMSSRLGWMWWEQICKYSSRDQLSFPYCVEKCGISLGIIPGCVTMSKGHNQYIIQTSSHRK
jgi:hypothetical protein